MAGTLAITFAAGALGDWRIERISAVRGEGLPWAPRLSMRESAVADDGSVWQLRGVVSHPRYATGAELKHLAALSPPLSRPGATVAAFIPITKSKAWWEKGQDERRAIFEESSRHIARSMKHLPTVARRLHHARDLGESFDFLTWFEYAPHHLAAFEELVQELRTTEEWRYIEREIDIRLVRDPRS